MLLAVAIPMPQILVLLIHPIDPAADLGWSDGDTALGGGLRGADVVVGGIIGGADVIDLAPGYGFLDGLLDGGAAEEGGVALALSSWVDGVAGPPTCVAGCGDSRSPRQD